MSEQATVQYFVILTVQFQTHPGAIGMCTITRTVQAKPAATREGLYGWARQELPEHARGGNTVFFSAEPNQLGGTS